MSGGKLIDARTDAGFSALTWLLVRLLLDLIEQTLIHHITPYRRVLGVYETSPSFPLPGKGQGLSVSRHFDGAGLGGVGDCAGRGAQPDGEGRRENFRGWAKAAVWVLPADEEIVVARAVAEVLGGGW